MPRRYLPASLADVRVLDSEPLHHKMLSLGLNVRDLASRSITSEWHVYRIVIGSVARPDALVVARICQVLGVDAGSVWVHPETLAARLYARRVLTPARIRARGDRFARRHDRRIWPGRHSPPGPRLL